MQHPHDQKKKAVHSTYEILAIKEDAYPRTKEREREGDAYSRTNREREECGRNGDMATV